MRSMTGYGRHSMEAEGRMLLIELKSVNHRFLDLNIKLPRAHNFLEGNIRKIISAHITRGHIDVFVTYNDLRENKTELIFDESLSGAYVKIAENLSDKYGMTNDFSVFALMRSPDVISELPIEDDENIIIGLYEECLTECVKKLIEMKKTEGGQIKADLIERIAVIRESLLNINERAPLVSEDYKVKIKSRIEEALNDVAVDEARLLNEVAFFADKSAIDEEITRLDAHLDNFMALLGADEPNGRKMDFLVQEMNRESNTIGSKANDLVLVNEVLKMKAEIEKIREQIQNIE